MNKKKEVLEESIFGLIAGSCFISMGVLVPISIIFTSLEYSDNTSVHYSLLSFMFVTMGVSSIISQLVMMIHGLASRVKKLEEKIKVNSKEG